ncbi:MAG: GGDEF domain-containing protein [Thiobacillus sp.]|nr:GGDEF domain-containing protein [Thiobacillus sp.]
MNAPLIILVTSCFVALAMAGVLFVISRTYPKSIRGLTDWSLAALVMALSLPLLIAREHLPDLLSIVLANLMLLAGFMLMNAGIRKFSGTQTRINRALLVLFVLAYVSLFAWFTYVHPNVAMRVATLSLFTLVVIFDQLRVALKELPRTAGRNILVFSLTVLIGARVVRLVSLMFGIEHPTGVFDASVSQLVYLAIPSIMIPLGTISLVLLASEKLHQDLEFTSRYDDLTQCLNKRAAMEELKREIARARRHGSKLSIMLIDLDNFKHINDTHGHLEGDKVLVDFSKRAKRFLRETDQLSRFGGDEFMAVLPDTSLELASVVAERLHEASREGQSIAWSVSIGLSEWRGQDDTLASLLTRADKALYQSKALGRNQTQSI